MIESNQVQSGVGIPTVDSFDEETVSSERVDELTHAYHWGVLKHGFDALLVRRINSAPELEQWIVDVGEFFAAQFQAECLVEWRVETTEEYTGLGELDSFIRENIDPLRKWAFNDVYCSLLASPFLKDLDDERYGTFIEHAREQVSVFSVPGLTLERQAVWLEASLGQWLGSIEAGVAENEEDPELELVQLLESASLPHNKAAIDSLITASVQNQADRARASGMPVIDFLLASEGYSKVSAEQWSSLHEDFKAHMVPLVSSVANQLLEGGDDRAVSPYADVEGAGIAYAKEIFSDPQQVLKKAAQIFDRISPEVGLLFREMDSRGEIYLEESSSDFMQAGAYNFMLEGRPRIVAGILGVHIDFSDLCHEGGHALYSIAASRQAVMWNRTARHDLDELIATAFELIGSEHFDVVLDPAAAREAQKELVESYLLQMNDWFMRSAFVLAIHDDISMPLENRPHIWQCCISDYTPHADWSEYAELAGNSYLIDEAVHLPPVYRARYMLGTAPAIDVWLRYREDPVATVRCLDVVMRAGGSIDAETIYSLLEIPSPTSPRYLEGFASRVAAVLPELGG